MSQHSIRNPFTRYPVVLLRVESGDVVDERFWILEVDLPNDNLGPRALPESMSEADVRKRLRELGLDEHEADARIAWARQWATTRTLPAGQDPSSWLPDRSRDD